MAWLLGFRRVLWQREAELQVLGWVRRRAEVAQLAVLVLRFEIAMLRGGSRQVLPPRTNRDHLWCWPLQPCHIDGSVGRLRCVR